MYNCKVIADSVSEWGVRLTTFEVTYPLIIHAEIMTHRVFSRNVASNRAIPVSKLIESVETNPFVPDKFPKNQAGMQNSEWLEGLESLDARVQWYEARDAAVTYTRNLTKLNVHKQIANRLLAPFLWTTAVITATDWNNFFTLRCHPAAQPEIQRIAYMMKEAYDNSIPEFLAEGSWHLPYITEKDYDWARENAVDKFRDPMNFILKTSIGRCARVSYLRQSTDTEPQKDIELCERLIYNRHMSPTEHVATPEGSEYHSNFRGWVQYRKLLTGESGE